MSIADTITRRPLRERRKRLPKGKPMTFAVGMLSFGGLIVAADTQLTRPDGTTDYASKVKAGLTGNGSYVLAYSAEETNAADSLLDRIADELTIRDFTSLSEFKDRMRDAMKDWASQYTVPGDQPFIMLIAGAFVKEIGANPKDIGLFLCGPPGAVVQKTQENSSGYVCSGAGGIISDPLFKVLFARPASSQVRLAQIAYLMYRVKKDCAGACGGETDAVFLPFEHSKPLWIHPRSFKQAEDRGWIIDEALAAAAGAAIPEATYDGRKSLQTILDDIQRLKAGPQDIDFQVLGGGTIR